MLDVYITKNKNVHEKVKILIARRICACFEIDTTENGKPYIEGNPLYFSLSHSGNKAVIAISDAPVGIDLEAVKKRNFDIILSRFTEREREEAKNDKVLFYKNWVAKEAFIKMCGGTLARYLKRLEFCGGNMFYNGKKQAVIISEFDIKNAGICAICGGQPFFAHNIKRFKLLKGEKLL